MKMVRSQLKILVAKLKDKFLVKVPVHDSSPAPCPQCGYIIEVPLVRSPVPISCSHCNGTSYTVAVGLLDANKERLQFVHAQVINTIQTSSLEYYQGQVKHTIN